MLWPQSLAVPPRSELLEHVARLGREFVRRRMPEHAEILRLYHLAIRHGFGRGAKARVEILVDAEFVAEWERILGIAPDSYPEHPRTARCPKCRAPAQTERTFPGGALMRCSADPCGARWVERDG